MRYPLSPTGTLLLMLSLGALLNPALAKSERETVALREAKVTLSDAVSVAQNAIPGGKAVDADLVTTSDGKVIYSIELTKVDAYNLLQVSVDMQNGSVIEVSQKQVAAKDLKRVKAVEQAKVTMIEAIGIAAKELPGGIVAAAEAKPRGGQVVYVVDIEIEQKGLLLVVHVDLDSGRVLSVEPKVDN
jgi:uncharacterized membrane protein YkoI